MKTFIKNTLICLELLIDSRSSEKYIIEREVITVKDFMSR
jgi:hypothetical protein